MNAKIPGIDGIGMTSARTRQRLIDRLRQKGIDHPAVLERLNTVPRHLFVDEALASRAYEDTALPIGQGQTISQPYVVARMTIAALGAGEPKKVLEIGTGCGYQTAVLAGLAGTVYSIERIAILLTRAKQRLRQLGIRNVRFRHGDGNRGWPGQAPYDAIIVTAAPERVPPELKDQIADGGRLVIPIGSPGRQELLQITRRGDQFHRHTLDLVSFVPLLGGTD